MTKKNKKNKKNTTCVGHHYGNKHKQTTIRHDSVVVEFTSTYAFSVYRSNRLCMGSIPAVGKVYSIQHFMVQFGSNLKKVRGYPVFLLIDDAYMIKWNDKQILK